LLVFFVVPASRAEPAWWPPIDFEWARLLFSQHIEDDDQQEAHSNKETDIPKEEEEEEEEEERDQDSKEDREGEETTKSTTKTDLVRLFNFNFTRE